MKPQEKRGIFIYSPTHVSPVWTDCEQSSYFYEHFILFFGFCEQR